MTTSTRMEDDDLGHLTERILNLTLEIIYLLTGEGYKVVKEKCGELLTPNNSPNEPPRVTGTPPPSLRTEINNKKILEVINKIVDLLTGETESLDDFNIIVKEEDDDETDDDDDMGEEWVYIGYKSHYKNFMMGNEPPLTSPDGSSKRNPPERCPRPLYSRDSTQEDLTVPHHDQGEEVEDIKVEIKEEEDETLVSGAQQSMEEGEVNMRSKQEESSLHLDTDGRHVWKNTERNLILSTDCYEGDDDITQHSPGVNPITHNRHHRPFHSETSMDPSNPEESSDQSQTVTPDVHLRSHMAERTIDPLNFKETLSYGGHTGESSLSSLVCGNLALVRIEKSKSAESPYFSPGNGKRFIQDGDFLNHQRIYKGERPFFCSECGKGFSHKKTLAVHKKIHSDERPYVCSECGKSFIKKGDLFSHQRIHTGERPFFCTECGKRFTKKLGLTRHFKIHTGERPFSCSECGKSFTQHSILLRHKIIHTGEKSFSCSECGKRFSRKGSLVIHLKIHTRDRTFS